MCTPHLNNPAGRFYHCFSCMGKDNVPAKHHASDYCKGCVNTFIQESMDLLRSPGRISFESFLTDHGQGTFFKKFLDDARNGEPRTRDALENKVRDIMGPLDLMTELRVLPLGRPRANSIVSDTSTVSEMSMCDADKYQEVAPLEEPEVPSEKQRVQTAEPKVYPGFAEQVKKANSTGPNEGATCTGTKTERMFAALLPDLVKAEWEIDAEPPAPFIDADDATERKLRSQSRFCSPSYSSRGIGLESQDPSRPEE